MSVLIVFTLGVLSTGLRLKCGGSLKYQEELSKNLRIKRKLAVVK